MDGERTRRWAAAIDGAKGVIGLAGEPFFRKWKSKEEFERVGTGSRIKANRSLVEAMGAAKVRPRVFISASAVGIYGFVDSDDEVTEHRRGFGAIVLPGTQWLPRIHIADGGADRLRPGGRAGERPPERVRTPAGHIP